MSPAGEPPERSSTLRHPRNVPAFDAPALVGPAAEQTLVRLSKGHSVMQSLKKFLADERGLESVEYALLGSIIIVLIVAAVTGLKDAIVTAFNNVAGAL
jgi:Flp pilus assembly pilin Flp